MREWKKDILWKSKEGVFLRSGEAEEGNIFNEEKKTLRAKEKIEHEKKS